MIDFCPRVLFYSDFSTPPPDFGFIQSPGAKITNCEPPWLQQNWVPCRSAHAGRAPRDQAHRLRETTKSVTQIWLLFLRCSLRCAVSNPYLGRGHRLTVIPTCAAGGMYSIASTAHQLLLYVVDKPNTAKIIINHGNNTMNQRASKNIYLRPTTTSTYRKTFTQR